MLGHLAAVLSEDQSQAHDGAEVGLAKHQRRDGHLRVEPAARLIDGLRDEVSRERPLKLLLRALHPRVPPLRERHRTGVIPGVDDLRDATRFASARRAIERDIVDERAVRIQRGQVPTGELGKFLARADAHLVILRASPDRQRRAPIALARQRPVDVVLQPVAVTAVLDGLRMPRGRLVLGEQLLLDRGRPDVPRRLGVVEQRGVASPAVRVAVLVVELAEQQAPLGQVLQQDLVGRLEELPAHQGDLRFERAVRTDGVHHRQAVGAAGEHVVLTESGRLMDQTGAVLGGDVVGEDDVVGAARGLGEVNEIEGTPVRPALQLASAERLPQRPFLPQHLQRQRLGNQEGVLAMTGDHVGDVGVDGDRRVRDQRPRRRRPHQQVT